MISATHDYGAVLTDKHTVTIDVSLWENVIIQMVAPSGTILLEGSNDGGAITGSTDDTPQSALNFTTIVATKMLDGTTSSSLATAGLYKLTQPCKYLRFGGAAATATKAIVFTSKVV